jgi:AcrR family transcriptional regulator
MPERTNRRDSIVDAAAQLFVQNGYDATSVRQISDKVGVTEAALYYHFKDGKRELLEAVIGCQIPDLLHIVEECEGAETLQDFIVQFGQRMASMSHVRLEKLRWMVTEFPRMNPNERAMFHRKHVAFQNRLANAVEHFVGDADAARTMAATLACLVFGYGFLFINLDLQSVSDVKSSDIIHLLAQGMASTR